MTLVQQRPVPTVEPSRPAAPRAEEAAPTLTWWWVAVWAVIFAAGMAILLLGGNAFVATFVAGFGVIGAGAFALDAYNQRKGR